MIDLNKIQTDLDEWQQEQFGYQPTEILALGLSEEVGELHHVLLKRRQGIRQEKGVDNRELIKDAFADMFIYGVNLLTNEGINVEDAIKDTVKEVLKRNWRKYPKNGVSE